MYEYPGAVTDSWTHAGQAYVSLGPFRPQKRRLAGAADGVSFRLLACDGIDQSSVSELPSHVMRV